MDTYVALLRGINVGGNNKVEMPKLKAGFESLGHKEVVTYINSGNVIFQTRKKNEVKLCQEIQAMIESTFALSISVVLRSRGNIKKLCGKIPAEWTNDAQHKTDVMFLWDNYSSKKSFNLIKTNPKVDTLAYIDGAIVWHLKKKDYSKSRMNDLIGTPLYKHMTIRNINTVRKLHELMSETVK